ncbi:MAG: hypothetical protein LBT67_02990 [Holosporaceae bacterium]|jgi:hypothetical protein|nr:hypothetical protein [Holosporaceae bacterium]
MEKLGTNNLITFIKGTKFTPREIDVISCIFWLGKHELAEEKLSNAIEKCSWL